MYVKPYCVFGEYLAISSIRQSPVTTIPNLPVVKAFKLAGLVGSGMLVLTKRPDLLRVTLLGEVVEELEARHDTRIGRRHLAGRGIGELAAVREDPTCSASPGRALRVAHRLHGPPGIQPIVSSLPLASSLVILSAIARTSSMVAGTVGDIQLGGIFTGGRDQVLVVVQGPRVRVERERERLCPGIASRSRRSPGTGP